MRGFFSIGIFLICCLHPWWMRAADLVVSSPDGRLTISFTADGGLKYELRNSDKTLISYSPIALNLEDGQVIGAGTIASVSSQTVNNQIDVFVGKNKTLLEKYNELTIKFVEGYDIIVRAYNEGIAYRFVTRFSDSITVKNEDLVMNFADDPTVYFPECDSYRNFERVYNIYPTVSGMTQGKWAVSPTLFAFPGTDIKLAITEADTYDYPGMYVTTNGDKSMKGLWVRYPLTVEEPDNYYSNHLPTSRAAYIARTNGIRAFPWRVFIVSDNDAELLNNNLVYMLAEPCRLNGDLSWITPGKSAWEWWHKSVLEGVDFPSGNTNLSFQLYKYYVDWAAENNLEYMTIDAGWGEQNLYLQLLCNYAKGKNVKIIVWTWVSCVLENPNDWIADMKNKGVAGAKIDFFERNDQIAMRWGYQMAQKLADNKMVAIFHGCPVPTGLNRTFPNILNFEAVCGEEDNFWRSNTDPAYHTLFPFIRSLAGPEDYTPGSLRNVTKEQFRPIDENNTPPMSMGTRAHELSMYVIYDHWLGYLSDSPTEYNKFPDIKEFLSKVPSTWDSTVPLKSKLGEYILIAKQKGEEWYVGGMTNWTARDLVIDFSFLPDKFEYQADILYDSDDSDSEPTHYSNKSIKVQKGNKLTIHAAKGGGFVIRLHDRKAVNNEVVSSSDITVSSIGSEIHVRSSVNIKHISIYDLSGRLVCSNNYDCDQETLRVINMPASRQGALIISVATENNLKSFKIIN
ncbi:MAG: glycoside hydrolase family 97 catalytic domain-containing protein [Tannerella sp.]|jgi:alpha-glucosidase|nr:glycoside hydrolase family 97 catalytic domain-containing protein [Tannerella sp.]